MTPAETVTHVLGVRPLARMLGLSPSAVMRWKERDGQVPNKHHRKIIDLAEGQITPHDLIYGRGGD